MKKKIVLEGQTDLFGGIKEINTKVAERLTLKERADSYGVDSLFNYEILHLLTNIDIDVIKNAINNFGIIEIMQYRDAIKATPTQMRKLELLYRFIEVIYHAKHKEKIVLDTSQKAGNYCKTLFLNKVNECFFVISVDAQNRINYSDLVHEGTISECAIYPRLVISSALKYNANSVIFCHSHPGGSLKPSKADIDVTKKLKTSLESIDIKVLDHIIIGGDNFFSFSENGYL